MIRTFLRSVGFVLVACAFAALVVDGSRSIAAKSVMIFSIGDTAGWLLPARTEALRKALAALPSGALRGAAETLFTLPTSLAAVIVGAALLYAGRPRRPEIGYVPRP